MMKLEVKMINTFMFMEMFDNEFDIVLQFYEFRNVFICYLSLFWFFWFFVSAFSSSFVPKSLAGFSPPLFRLL